MTGSRITGRVAVVTGASSSLGAGMAAALEAAGATVHRVDGPRPEAEGSDGFDVLVHAWWPEPATERMELADVDDARFEAVWEGAMHAAFEAFQLAFAAMRGRGGGRIITVTPTLSLTGAAGYVPLATAIEGVRVLSKSAARQWGEHGITVNCLAPAPPVDAGAISLAVPALGRGPGDPVSDLGPVVVFLASEESHFVTGATLCVDGGVWMSP